MSTLGFGADNNPMQDNTDARITIFIILKLKTELLLMNMLISVSRSI